MIDEILPGWVATAEEFGDPPHLTLFPEEEALVAGAADKRRREFRTSRHCAHRALRQLGTPPIPILRSDRGAPVWPEGITGSITHCHGYRAAAASREALAIGIDAEPHQPAPAGILDRIATPSELEALNHLALPTPDRLLFSAKEAVYKTWYPLTGEWLGFKDATLTFTLTTQLPITTQAPITIPTPPPDIPKTVQPSPPTSSPPPASSPPASFQTPLSGLLIGTFEAEILVRGAGWPTHFSGRWLAGNGLIITAIAIHPTDRLT